MHKIRLLLHFLNLIFLLLVLINANAQKATVRGFVYEKETGEPIIFTNVYLLGTTYGSSTDVNGYYTISQVPPGNYTLTVTYLGYDTIRIPVTLKEDQILTKKLTLIKGTIELGFVEVSAEKQEAKTEIKTSVINITPKQIKQIPTVGGEPDLAQYLQVLPGVIFTGDQGGQLYIRGGSPIQNKVLLDGMVIYNPFHSIGLFSVFDADIIRNVDVYTGGFNAEYGGRISSIMDITTRDGNKRRITGKVSASPFSSKLLVEGPIKKYSEENKSSASYIFSCKNSYLRQSSKIFYTYIDTAGLPYNFTDLYGKVSLNGSTGSKLNLFGFNFNDRVNYQSVSDLHWNAAGFGSNFLLIPSNLAILVEGDFSYSSYTISLEEEDKKPRSSQITGFNIGFDFTYFLGKDEIKYGLEVLGFSTDFNFYNSVNRKIENSDNTTELAAFVKYKKIFDKLLIEPSFRLHYYSKLSASPEPRLGLKYNATDNFRIKFAGGFYSQNLISGVSDRDVVNLFYGFISSPSNIQDSVYKANGTVKEITHKLQKARHVILGFEFDLTNHININVESYIKQFTQLTNLNRNKLFDDTPEYSDKPFYQKKDFIIETGKAYGGDFLLKYDYKRWYVWLVYSLGYVKRYDGVLVDYDGNKTDYPTHFDRRHNINLVTSYTFGKDLNWEANLRWNLGSGFPFTETQGYYGNITFSDGINTDYTTINEELGIIYGELNQGRLPTYHRLDLTLKRKFELGDNSTLETNVSVTNVYNQKNLFYFNRVRNEWVDQLPILPSFGLNLTF
ncbi:MAG: carboxypeptidase-like regulatory domain-containing protein [Bacteroidota bacterium]